MRCLSRESHGAIFGRGRTKSSQGPAAASDFILRVRLWSPVREQTARQILQEHGANTIKIRDIEIDKRPEDIPWISLRPDPWLGNERLRQP